VQKIKMPRPFSLWPLWLVLVALGITAAEAAPEDWHTYNNDRYGFSLQYPSSLFAVERTAEAGDGKLFVAKNGEARLLVGSLSNDGSFTPATYQAYIARNSYADYRISYSRLGGSWFALSGTGNGRIFYEKAMFSCGGRRINSFALIYPSDQRHIFDPILERIENTFRSGTKC
jgi:hypothetical protein